MTKKLLYLALFSFLISFSQEKQKSLLWEISGNGLEKPSYIYGTMHVSKKVAFRLDDVFFEALENSESIALESDPSTWLEHNYETLSLIPQNFSSGYDNSFYSALFKMEPPKELMIRRIIRSDNNMINGYLYRKQSNLDNFEEETYLDMFIYQAGKKKNKPIISLEDLEEAQYLTSKASKNAYKKKLDPWLAELYEKENPYLLQENTYRERNLDRLDSIGNASNTEFFREHMLYKRNSNMVTVLDSVSRKKSVFAGVGAAHLPGKKGMLNLLREKGYTVKPLLSKRTKKGKETKQALENFVAIPSLKMYTTPDGFISLKSFTELKEFYYGGQKFIIAPDMTNGAYLAISRFNTFEYLPNDKTISLDRLDNFLFEDIPGDIVSKEKIKTPFPGISILNKTKKGDFQKYHIYKTPLELIIIKLAGPKDYVLNYEKDIFNSIKFKERSAKQELITSPFNKYEVLLPAFNNSDNLYNAGNKLMQGVINNDYYFVKESVVPDINYIEEDAFEAKYSVEKYLEDLDLNISSAGFTETNYKSYKAVAKIDSTSNRSIHLKSIVKDGSYYLLGYVGEKSNNAETFFKSFTFKNTLYDGFEKHTDTSLHFSVLTNTKPITAPYNNYNTEHQKPYDRQNKKTIYFSKANEQIYVSRTKFHDLKMYHNIDSLWNEIDTNLKVSSEDFQPIITHRKKGSNNNSYTYSFKYKDSLSAKVVSVKNILKKGVLFEIKSLADSIAKPSAFITNFYNSFIPKDTLLGTSIFSDKTDRFFTALKNDDSIVLNTNGMIKFKNKHANKIINLLKTYTFPENKAHIKSDLIEQLGKLKNPKVIPFLKTMYIDSYSDPQTQTDILKAILSRKNKTAQSHFIKLLSKDLPIEAYAIKPLFRTYRDSLELKKELYPELLEYSSIREYKEPIYNLLAKLKDSGLVKPKIYKRYKKQIINDGKIEVKRNLSKDNDYNYSALDIYVKLIFPHRKEQLAKEFFNKLLDVKDAYALTTYYVLLEEANETIPNKLKEKTLHNYKNQALLVRMLYKKGLKPKYLKQNIDQEKYAKSYLFDNEELEGDKDSITFLTEKTFKTDNGKQGSVYFYKLHKVTDYGEYNRLYYVAFLTPKNSNDIATKRYYKSEYRGNKIGETDKDEDLIEDVLELIKYKTRKRINTKL
ncbi:TraB/GumN family protein [Pontimicrobium sp. MEBiC06410]